MASQTNEDESGLVDDVSDIDDEQKSPPSPTIPLTIGYDLSPFEPGEANLVMKAETSEVETLSLSGIDHGKDSSDDTKNREVESLLQSEGSLQEQLARIEMYNTRLLDSESEDDDEDEDSLQQQNIDLLERKEEKRNDSSAYAGLCDEQEDDESSSDVVGSINGFAPLVATMQFSEEFTCHQNISKGAPDAETSDEPHTEINEKDKNDIVDATPDTRGNAYAESVPLLKPPPLEKMQAFLQSKVLIDASKKESIGHETGNLFEANFVTNDDNQEGDCPPSTINHHNDQAPGLTAFGLFDTIGSAFIPAGSFSNEVVQLHENDTDVDKEDLIPFSPFSVGD